MFAIERGAIANKSKYVAITNETYVQIADTLGIKHEYYSSANNTGNVMESLSWFAYEQKKFDFILSIAKFAVVMLLQLTQQLQPPQSLHSLQLH